MKKYFQESLKILTMTATVTSLHSYYKNITDEPIKNRLKEYISENKKLDANLSSTTLEFEKYKAKAQAFGDRLGDVMKSVEHEKTLIPDPDKIDPNNKTIISECKAHFENLAKESEKASKIIKEYIEWVNNLNNGKNFWGGSNPSSWIDTYKEILNEWYAYMSTLTLEQLGALAHLFSAFSILFSLISIITIVYSNMLLEFFKIEEKFPKLARYIRIRQKFQQYYLFLNFLIIILILLALIFINFTVLIGK